MQDIQPPRLPTDRIGSVLLADRLRLPSPTSALLWDMDGVLLDTLILDYQGVNQLLHQYIPNSDQLEIPTSVIRANFAYDLPESWSRMLATVGVEPTQSQLQLLVEANQRERQTALPPVHEGVFETLQAAHSAGIPSAVVSNSPIATIEHLLSATELLPHFELLVGLDNPPINKKPAPDCYLEAAKRLRVDPAKCVALEDSLLGIEAAHRAGCFTIGIATGANSWEQLSASPFIDRCYTSLAEMQVKSSSST
ncbi:MAG: HAD family hydrolase [Candidatus Dormibacteraceae bacterium]